MEMEVKSPFIIFKNIKIARISAGLSQSILAKKIGVSTKTISAYETGRAIPPSPTLAKIAEITNVSFSEIIGARETKSQKDDKILESLESINEKLASIEKVLVKILDKNEK